MTAFVIAPDDIKIDVKDNSLATYQFGNHAAKHHFCKSCGIYTFHQTVNKLGYYRINVGCIDGVDSSSLPFEIYDGASL